MGATSVGEIGLDLVVNQKNFNRQMGGIQNLAKKAGKALAAAFTVKKIVDFGKSCIDLGSDLSEVQNVVDVTFPAMSKQVDKFAKNAATAFGLSETMAKKYTGTFGAMAKAFGFGEQQAYEMSTTLTGLAGDVASFYNLSQDEAYTKLKSVFTGETESLKDLGVVMTQTALDAYALANGYGKTTAAMSEAEKVALRYSFVQSKLATASGDFMRTSDGWANQVRILKLQTESFMAAIGQGLINVLTPAIKVVNTLMSKLVQLANVFKAFTDKFTGKKTDDVTSGLTAAENAAAGISDNIDAAGKAAKKLNGLLTSDELDILSQNDQSSGTAGESNIDLSGMQAATKEAESAADRIAEKLTNAFSVPMIDKFVEQFNSGFRKIDFTSIKRNFGRIVSQLPGLAKTACKSIKTISDSIGGYLGNRVGNAFAIIAEQASIATDGVATYLENNADKITAWCTDINTAVAKGFGNLTKLNEIISSKTLAALEKAKPEITESINELLTGCTDFGMSLGTILAEGFEIATERTTQWAEDNQRLIERTITKLLDFGAECTSLAGQIIGDIGNSIDEWWESRGSSTFGSIIDMWNDIRKVVLQLWNDVVMPILTCAKDEIQKLWENHLRPLWDNILNLVSAVGDYLGAIWETRLKPLIDYLVSTVGPTVKEVASIVVSIFGTVFTIISDKVSSIIKALGGVLDFLSGVFTGNWKKAWNGIKDIVEGIWNDIWATIKGVVNLIVDGINLMIEGVYSTLRAVVNGIGSIAEKAGNVMGKDWGFSMPGEAPKIPKLASGGYVRANTPQLAMIGDNRHQGEVVAPENKLQEMANSAVQAALSASGALSGEKLDKIIALIDTIIRVLMTGSAIEIDGIKFAEIIRKIDREYFKATGKHLLSV